jgi:YVTN family beta-propeller protein
MGALRARGISMTIRFLLLVAAVCGAFAPAAASQTPATKAPTRNVSDPGVITTRQAISPAGAQTVFDSSVFSVGVSSDADVWALNRTSLLLLDPRDNRVKAAHALPGDRGVRGLSVDPAGRRVAATHAVQIPGKPSEIRLEIGDVNGLRNVGGGLGTNAVGVPAWSGDDVLVPLLFDNRLAIVSGASGIVRQVPVGIAPVAVATEKGLAYVANWGGQVASGSEANAPTGLETGADKVRIDARGVAKPGSISIVDLAAARVLATIEVGRHPTALAIDAAGQKLFVANTNDDSVSVIDLKLRKVARTISLRPFSTKVDGVAPTALAFDTASQRLYVALGGINSVAVLDIKRDVLLGLIPTGWYPNTLALDGTLRKLIVGTMLGVGSGSSVDGPDHRYVHANRGTVHVIDLPGEAQLASYTTVVAENNRMPFAGAASAAVDRRAPKRAVPQRSGEASLIEHVVYIVKENRTYDQLFGDLPRGNGEPDFVLFGDDVTPNQRKLAMDFVLLDNIYATGGNSASGHQWVTQANEPAYTLWPGYQGRSYPFDGTDPLAYSARGFIWDAALARGKSVAVFGEYAPRLSWDQAGRVELLKRWKAGETLEGMWNTRSPIPPLDQILVRDFPAYTMAVPDVVRAQRFIDELKGYEASGKMPNLTLLQLPSDHTSGTTPGMTSAKSMVADNDLAVGMVVEALSKSKFWSKMVIYVIEDDAQNGVDHVDGHRTVGLVVSPYTKRGSVDSTFYSIPSILKTIELQLGLPTLSLFDLIANDMRASFTDTQDLSPYSAITPKQDLLEINPQLADLSGSRREGAIASAAMRWDVPDAVPSALLNRITWHEVRGWDAPFPEPVSAVFSPFFIDEDEDEEEDAERRLSGVSD